MGAPDKAKPDAPRRGRPRTRPDGARKVIVVLTPEAAAAWDQRRPWGRSAWVSKLIVEASKEE